MTNPMLQIANVRHALRQLGVQPTRALGQNFLIDGTALATIVAAGEVTADTFVVEVGPGLGVLTWELVRSAGQVIAIELDSRLAARLRTEFAMHSNLTIYQQDVLTIDVAQMTQGQAYRVVANLPYAITSPVLRLFLEATHPPDLMTVLVQREVAQRICAEPGDMSVLAHAMQIRAVPELVAVVAPESFMPAPAVYSAVLRLRRRPTPLVDPLEEPGVMKVIKAGFLHARKQLGNSLASGLAAHGLHCDRSTVQELLRTCDIDPMRRAETVSIDEWVRVSRALMG